MMRLVIAILLVILGVNAAAEGRYLSAAADLAFAALAGMLAYATLPDRTPLPRRVVLGTLAAGILLWLASLAVARG